MFDKLEGLVDRLDTVLQELNDPDVAGNQNRFRDLMKEQNELTPIVEKYKEYKAEKQNIEDSLMLLEEESDEEMKELAKEELNESKANVERLEEELKILLIPKDPMDDKNIIVEMRAGAGGDEAGLFVADVARMYRNYAESKRWKVNTLSFNESGIGGFKELVWTGCILKIQVRKRCTPCTENPCNRVWRKNPYIYNYGSDHARSGRCGSRNRYERL